MQNNPAQAKCNQSGRQDSALPPLKTAFCNYERFSRQVESHRPASETQIQSENTVWNANDHLASVQGVVTEGFFLPYRLTFMVPPHFSVTKSQKI